MKKKILTCALLIGLVAATIGGCQSATRSFGGSITIEL